MPVAKCEADKYKLVYLDCRALGEPIRLLFVIAGVSFEDQRIPLNKYQDAKKYGFGQVPVLYVNGKQLTQSLSIAKYLAKKFNLISNDEFLAAKCDEVVEIATELRLLFRSYIVETNNDLKSKIFEELKNSHFPKYYNILNSVVGETQGEFITGQGVENLSWADLFVANWLEIWNEHVVTPEFSNQYQVLKTLYESVFGIPTILDYVETR